MTKTTEHYIEDAIRLYNSARYQEGLIACEYAIQLDATCAKAYHGRGLILARQKKYNEALKNYQKSCQIESKNAKLHADMGNLFYILNDYENSGLSYKKAIQLDSKFESVYREKAKVLIDSAFRLRTPWTRGEAIIAFQRVLLFNPDDTIARSELSKLQKVNATLSQHTSYIAEFHPCNCKCPVCINY